MANLGLRQSRGGSNRVKANIVAVATVVLSLAALGVAGFGNDALATTPAFLSSLSAPNTSRVDRSVRGRTDA